MCTPLPTQAEVELLVRDARRKVRLRPDPGDIEPAQAGEESVWSYPRPPRVEPFSADVRVMLKGQEIARSSEVLRVLETSGPPVIYLPAAAFKDVEFIAREDWSLCEWKGVARYLDLRCRTRHVDKAGWCFPQPFRSWARLPETDRVHCALSGKVCMPSERRASSTSRRRLLRGLDHRQSERAVQGRRRNGGLVRAPQPIIKPPRYAWS